MADEVNKSIDANQKVNELLASGLIEHTKTEESLKSQLDIQKQITTLTSKENALVTKKRNIQEQILELEKDQAENINLMLKYQANSAIYETQIHALSTRIRNLKREELGISKQLAAQEHMDRVLSRLKLKGVYDAMKELQDVFANHKWLGFLTILSIGFTSFLKIFNDLDEAAAHFRISMGFLRPSTAEIEKNIRAIYFTMIQAGVEAKDLYESLQAGAATMGTMQSITLGMAGDMALMSKQLGVSQTTSAAFAQSMGMAAKSNMDSQRNIALFTAALSEAAGTNLNEVMQDVANATKTSYQFMIKQPSILVKAAVEAKRMGTSLADAAKSASSLLNFTDSVNAEMQASVLLGSSLNLQRLRELSYRKQLGAVNKEILDIANKTHFEDLDPFQQDAVAKALGKSADEVGKMLQADREMRRIRGDGSLSKELATYDKLKDAGESLVKITGEGNRANLMNISNQTALKSIALALKSIYQSMFAPLVDVAAIWLPKIASFLNEIKQKTNDWLVPLTAGLIFIGGPLVLGKIVSLIKSRIFSFFGKDVAEGAKTAGEGIKDGFIDKIAKGMENVEKIATGIGRIIVKLGVAVGRGIGSVLQFTLRGLALGLKALGNPQVLLGAVVLGVVGLAFMAFGKAAEFVAQALKSLDGVGLGKIAGGLALVGVAMLPLALVTPLMLPLAIGLFAFGAALRFVVGPAERMGLASVKLGEGLEKSAASLAQIASLNMISVVKQFRDLSQVISGLSKEMNSIPDIKVEKLQSIIVKSAQMATESTDQAGEQMLSALMDIKSSVDALRKSLESGGISANVQIDAQRLDSATARSLAFRGTKSPQPSII